MDDHVRKSKRLCFFAHYDEGGVVGEHVLHYLRALRACGFVVVVLSTAELSAFEQQKITALGANVVLRANEGMDFGGWIDACIRFFPIQADLLLLANDSVYGPLSDLGNFIDRLTAEEADFYGAVESYEIATHLQSWFVLLRPAAYRSTAFGEMMCRPMANVADKGDLVVRYEVGLTQALVAAGFRYHSSFSMASHGRIARHFPYNPAHIHWREVICAGVPFLKIELLRFNLVRVTDTDDWRDVIAKLAPHVVELIAADLTRRGRKSPPSFGAMSYAPAIYWPELRRFLIADFKEANGSGGNVRLKALRVAMAVAWLPRRLYIHFIDPPAR
jgi:lipopolysaccharide biosynthesis protein